MSEEYKLTESDVRKMAYLQKGYRTIYKDSVHLLGINNYNVHVKDVFELVKVVGESYKHVGVLSRGSDEDYPSSLSFDYEGVTFISLRKESVREVRAELNELIKGEKSND